MSDASKAPKFLGAAQDIVHSLDWHSSLGASGFPGRSENQILMNQISTDQANRTICMLSRGLYVEIRRI